MLGVEVPDGRSERYVVYALLDTLVATTYDVLNGHELELQELRGRGGDVRGARAYGQPAADRRRADDCGAGSVPSAASSSGSARRIGRGGGSSQTARTTSNAFRKQIGDIVDAINATGDALANLIDLPAERDHLPADGGATVFLPLTFLVGFFGMNFGWMVRSIDTSLAFILLGVAFPVLPRGGRLDRRPPACGARRRRGR